METDEEFWARMRKFVDDGLHRGVEMGWWDGVDEKRREPIPFPIIIKISDLPQNATMAHAMAKAGVFKSVSEARKNGWNRPVEKGEWFRLTKRRLRVRIEE